MARGPSPNKLKIPGRQRIKLKRLVRKQRAPHVVVQRARVVLMAVKGQGTERIARAVGVTGRTVRKWKARFEADPRVDALEDAPRSGRPAEVPVTGGCQIFRVWALRKVVIAECDLQRKWRIAGGLCPR